MSRLPETKSRYRALGPLAVAALATLGLLGVARLSRTSPSAWLTGWATRTSRWDRLPAPLALATISSVLRRSGVPVRESQDPAEQIRRQEVSRVLRKVDLSPDEEEAVERMSRSLVGRLLRGPIPRVMARAEVEISFSGCVIHALEFRELS